MLTLLIAFAVSAGFTLLLVRSAKMHGHRSGDRDFSKPQKFHAVSVPRIGGLGILAGLLAGATMVWRSQGLSDGWTAMLLVACVMPAFAVGLVHDFTEALTPRGRLLAAALSALLAYGIVDAEVRQTDIPGIDWLLSIPALSLLGTLVTVAGIANAVNIIDGFNGLASMCVVLMLAVVCYVAFQVGDVLVGSMALAGIGAVLGFFVWNFPAGLIFLGDGGAYMLGFLVAELLILLINRNTGEVSPLFPLLVCIYPVFETVFSIYRRTVLRAVPASVPDGIHLHSLIHRRILRWAVGDRSARALTRRNSMTSPALWLLCMISVVPAALFFESTGALAVCLLIFAAAYLVLYWRIVRFRSPRWLAALRRVSVSKPPAESEERP